MGSKLILLLGIILATGLTYFCIQDKKENLTAKYAKVQTPLKQPITNNQQALATQLEENNQTKDTNTIPARQEETLQDITTTKTEEKNDTKQVAQNKPQTKEKEKPVTINKLKFFYTTDKNKTLQVNMNPSNKTLAFVDILDALCPNDTCEKNITFSKTTASKPWDENVIKIATFLHENQVKDGSVLLKEQTIKITGIFDNNSTLEKFKSLLQPLKERDFNIDNQTKLVQKGPSIEDIQRDINIALHKKPIYFHTNSDKLLRKSKKTLDEIITIINNSNLSLSFVVAGHTDASGEAAYNKYLSQKRANAVRRYLTKHNLKAKSIEAIGWGEEKPITANPYKKENRRVEIEIKKEKK